MTSSIPTPDDNQSLRELVTQADQSFRIFRQNAREPGWIDFPSLGLYRHLIHMANGIGLLLSARAARPAIPLLRSALEAYLSLEYIFQDRYEERSLAWLCGYYRGFLRQLELLDPTTKDGSKLQARIEKLFPDAASASQEAARIKKKLNSPPLHSINSEYDKREKRGPWPTWHSLDDPMKGRPSLKRLSERVDLEALYLVFYERWSQIIHAKEFDSFLSPLPNGTVEFDPLEGPASAKDPTIELGARTFIERSTPLMARKFGSID